MSPLVQIKAYELRKNRVPRGQHVVFEIDLQPNQQIVHFQVHPGLFSSPDRKTEDHHATAWVATNLGGQDPTGAPDASH